MEKLDDGRPTSPARRRLLRTTVAASSAALAGAQPRDVVAKEVRPPYTTPFVEELPVSRPKASASSLYPAPQKIPHITEAGRDPHQGWEYWPPKVLYSLEVKEASHSFHRELPPASIWGYDGTLPGPTFVSYYGQPVVIRIYNKLPKRIYGFGSPEISTHLHNGHSASESDGYAGNYFSETVFGPTLTRAGKYYDHHFPNSFAGYDRHPDTDGDAYESMGTLWYHDHRENFTAANVYRGLAGFYLLFDKLDSNNEEDPNKDHPDPGQRAFGLPSGVGVYDIPLVFSDPKFDASGMRVFDQFETDGHIGNKFAVNGKIQPYFKVARRKYRFRLLDGSPSRFYEFYLTHKAVNQAFTLISNDGNLLPEPIQATKIRIAPAERMDIIVDFSSYPIGSQLYLVNRLEQNNGRGPEGVSTKGVEILRFDVDRDAIDNSRIPKTLRPLPPITLSQVVKNRHFEFERENGGWVINGQTFDVEKAAIKVKRGTAEIWTLQGKGSWHHPIHIHLEEGRILTRNGKPPLPHEAGRKDVFVLNPGDVIRIFLRFRDFTGKYMMHCHNTVHEDHAMMLRFDVED